MGEVDLDIVGEQDKNRNQGGVPPQGHAPLEFSRKLCMALNPLDVTHRRFQK